MKKLEDYILAPGMEPKPQASPSPLFQDTNPNKAWDAATQMATERIKTPNAPEMPQYTPQYTAQINSTLDSILSAPEFQYDPNKDASYQSYKNVYQREGRRASEDTLGQMAAMTGGMPSTAATIAGQQQNSLYAAKLADKIPELKQIAYDMYNDKLNNQRSNLNTMMAADQVGYNQFRDNVGDFQTNRQFDYGVGRDAVSDTRYADETAYGRGRDAISDTRYADETAYGRGRDSIADSRYEDETAYGRGRDAIGDMRYADETAYGRGRDAVADSQWGAEFGYRGQRDAVGDQQWADTFNYNKQQDSQNRAASSKSSSSKSVDTLLSDMDSSSDPMLYLSAYYKDYGIDKSQVPTITELYSNQKKQAQFDPDVPTTQEMFSIVDNLMAEGYSEKDALDILQKSDNVDEQAWANFKSAYYR